VSETQRVLIVEDDPEIIRLHSLFLQRAGYEPIPALGGTQAIEMLAEIDVDLILLDLMMPDMDGWSVLRAVRRMEKLEQVPVIIVSVKHPTENQAEMEDYADLFEGYLMKPFVGEGLINLVKKTLG
jgi:DNA-binding response OmpR family regulator